MQLKKNSLGLILLFFVALGGVLASEENPPFKLIFKDGPFEVRYYPKMIVASAVTEESDNSLFRTLAGYIFGGNKSEKRIPMTAPVFMKRKAGQSWMMFFMPSNYTLESLPKPLNPKVKLGTFHLGKVAVLRYSGLNPKSKRLRKTEELLEWAKKKGINVISNDSIAAGYDSPWTLPWNRRNEVFVSVK